MTLWMFYAVMWKAWSASCGARWSASYETPSVVDDSSDAFAVRSEGARARPSSQQDAPSGASQDDFTAQL
jgi:hypothetical protein